MESGNYSGNSKRISVLSSLLVLLSSVVLVPAASASFVGGYDPAHFTLRNTNADGFVDTSLVPLSITLIGGNTGSGLRGTTDYTAFAAAAGVVTFNFAFSTLDIPGFDDAGFLLNGSFTSLATLDGQSGARSFGVTTGQVFGFRMETSDNLGEPGKLTISNFSAPVPEPGTAFLFLGLGAVLACCWSFRAGLSPKVRHLPVALISSAVFLALCASSSFAQQLPVLRSMEESQSITYTGSVDLSAVSRSAPIAGTGAGALSGEPGRDRSARRLPQMTGPVSPAKLSSAPGLPVSTSLSSGFLGLTHRDQRLSNGGNQFSTEPPDQGLAAGNGYVVEAVNGAFQVFNSSGVPLLPAPVALVQLFGLPVAINRITGVYGEDPGDPRIYFDQDSGHWFVVAWDQLVTSAGAPLNQSREHLAVSKTTDPTGTYFNYVIDTTLPGTTGCPCIPDFPQLGSDSYGFYISSNDFATASGNFVDANIRAISKAALIAGTATTSSIIPVPYTTGFEFTIHPATTPPGASSLLASNGVEYFMSSDSSQLSGNQLAVWALSNTGSLVTGTPTLTLSQLILATEPYTNSDAVPQKPGILPYGSSLVPPGILPQIDGGDVRIGSLVYSGGRLYTTLETVLADGSGRPVAGVAYFIVSPTFRGTVLSAQVLRQGYVSVNNNNLLRPAMAVNPQGKGAVVFTLVGPDYFPSAAFVPIDVANTGSAVQIVGAGFGPEDGFTGYNSDGTQGVARWGDYSAAAVDTDGSIWMATEFIPNAPRSSLANWGTFVFNYKP